MMLIVLAALVAFLAGVVAGWLLCLFAAVMGLCQTGWFEW